MIKALQGRKARLDTSLQVTHKCNSLHNALPTSLIILTPPPQTYNIHLKFRSRSQPFAQRHGNFHPGAAAAGSKRQPLDQLAG